MILRYIQDIGAVGLSFVMSFILSFFFMIEKKQMADFSKLFLKSDFDWFFRISIILPTSSSTHLVS